MKLLVQRVLNANVVVDSQQISSIKAGVLVFLGVKETDSESQVSWLVNKLANLRIFYDEEGKMNRSLLEARGEALIVSQFTLYGDCNGGRRPSFIKAAKPDRANRLYELFIKELSMLGVTVKGGVFGADMKVSLINDGPITLILERE